MITVAILGILAAVAVVSYSGYTRRARNSEATAVLANIRIKQEAYRAVFHVYSDLAGTWVPAGAPGATKTGRQITDANWKQLGAIPDGDIYFSYMGEAGAPGANPTNTYLASFIGDTTTDFWYGAMAVQDLNTDSKCEGFAVFSGSSTMFEVPEAAANCPN
jgi:type II secretory pathway pseudopilin PulG